MTPGVLDCMDIGMADAAVQDVDEELIRFRWGSIECHWYESCGTGLGDSVAVGWDGHDWSITAELRLICGGDWI